MDMLQAAATAPSDAFDYSQMDATAAHEAKAAVERYRERQKAYVLDTGRDLLAVKARLEHGLFLKWVQAEMGMNARTAQRAMNAAEALGDKSDTVSYLPATVLYELAAPSTPEPVREAVLRRIEAGEAVRADVILGEVQKAREEARERVAADREEARRAKLSPEQREEEDALRSKGQKRADALARRDERDRKENYERSRREEAEAALGAKYLVDRLGADEVVAFFARFDSLLINRILAKALKLAHAQRAASNPAVEISRHNLRESADFGIGWLHPEEQAEIREIAGRISAGEAVDPIRVVPREGGPILYYEIVEGLKQFHALVGVLHRQEILAQVAPPISPEAVAAIGAHDA